MSAIVIEHVPGDHLGLSLPAHGEALIKGGCDFFTRAFQASGALSRDNAVSAITRWEPCAGGSTGSKFFLDVDYAKPAANLGRQLFVKFSRAFSDPIRDQARTQLEPEVRLALLSREPGFPIRVPRCYYADYHQASGTGVLITERIPFGQNGIEPLYDKCLDYKIPNCIEHYRTIMRALAKLAGSHKAGTLGIEHYFPFDTKTQPLSAPIRYNETQLLRRVDKLEAFICKYSGLLPANVEPPEFITRLRREIPLLLQRENAIKSALHSKPDYIALIHWNANIDNAWFWRNNSGQLECGLMDWGGVGQMNLGLALWGALSAAETGLWREHEGNLLSLFIDEYAAAGGPQLKLATLQQHLYAACIMMSLSWLMDAPAMIQQAIPDLALVNDRFAPEFEQSESPRVQLRMFSNFLDVLEKYRL